jgi:peptidoglycan/xylan/chitin deacetylase (PgdA/CDA1 family)
MMQAYQTVRSDGNFSWPSRARIAVVLTSEYEPEYEIKPLTGGQPNYRQMAEMRYEATRGIWRILKILGRHGVPSTFFVNGATAQKYPDSVRAIAAQGHEVAAHSWNAADHFTMPVKKEDELIGRVIASLEKAAGTRPSGWLTPRAQISEHTIELIMKHGFTWHSDCFDDDLPYLLKANGHALVEVPRSTLTDDYAMMGNLTARPFGSHRDMLAVWIDEFDVLYREAETEPRLLSINWHQCMLGRPAVSKVLDDLLVHIKKHDRVWFARGCDIAKFWLANNADAAAEPLRAQRL